MTVTAPLERTGTRARILEVAQRLFVELGYDKSSLREIAEELGFTKAALYYHFRSKDEILRALASVMLDAFEPVVDAVTDDMSATKRQQVVILGWIDLLLNQRSSMQMMMEAHVHLQADELLKDVHERFHAAALKMAIALGGGPGASTLDAAKAAYLVGGLLDVAVQLRDESPEDLRAAMIVLANSTFGLKLKA